MADDRKRVLLATYYRCRELERKQAALAEQSAHLQRESQARANAVAALPERLIRGEMSAREQEEAMQELRAQIEALRVRAVHPMLRMPLHVMHPLRMSCTRRIGIVCR